MTFLPPLPMKRATEEVAERMGYDAGFNGPDTTNCHFSLFATPELTKAWEWGKKRGDEKRLSTRVDE